MHIIRAMRSRFTLLLTVALLADAGHRLNPVIDIQMRMKQGFSVFVMNWGDAGFKTIELGRAAAHRRK